MPAPDFGIYLSRDRFPKILRYWAFGIDGGAELLREKPWEEVDIWIRAFNKSRKEELTFGTDLRGGGMLLLNGGIPHLSFIQRKTIPLGTELKVVCEGTMGLCGFEKLQWLERNTRTNTKLLPLAPSAWLIKWGLQRFH